MDSSVTFQIKTGPAILWLSGKESETSMKDRFGLEGLDSEETRI